MSNNRIGFWIKVSATITLLVCLALGAIVFRVPLTALVRSGGSVELLRPMLQLDSSNVAVRLDAAKKLRGFGSEGAAAIPYLIRALDDDDADVRNEASKALGKIGPSSVPALSAALDHPQHRVRVAATYSLSMIGPAAVDGLIYAVADKNTAVRRVATRGLSLAQPYPAAATPQLVRALEDSDETVRSNACIALVNGDPSAAVLLSTAFHSPNIDTRRLALSVVERMGERGASAAPVLISVAEKDQDVSVRYKALETLSIVDAASPTSVDAFIKALEQSHPHVRRGAILALRNAKCEPERVAAALATILQKDSLTRNYAISALRDRNDAAARAVTHVLVNALKDENAEVRLHAADALATMKLEAEVVRPFLGEMLQQADSQSGRRLMNILAKYDRPESQDSDDDSLFPIARSRPRIERASPPWP